MQVIIYLINKKVLLTLKEITSDFEKDICCPNFIHVGKR